MILYNCKAIALNYIKYSESSIISKIFTREKGLQSFIVKGVRSKKSKTNLVCFEPLKLSEITASYNNKSSLQIIKQIALTENSNYKKINIQANFISMFIAEVLTRTIKENLADHNLFDFIWETKQYIINEKNITKNFTLLFLLKLSDFLGFPPSKKNIINPFFDLEKGKFVLNKNNNTINKDYSSFIKHILQNEDYSLSSQKRSELLDILIRYYKAQNHELNNLNSQLIIKSMLF